MEIINILMVLAVEVLVKTDIQKHQQMIKMVLREEMVDIIIQYHQLLMSLIVISVFKDTL